MILEEEGRKREILIGRSTFLDPKTGVRIVDWRDAPVSRVYYRCEEGDDYDEIFGDREVEGEVLLRRNLSITTGKLRRIGTPQGTFRRSRDDFWRRMADMSTKLSGGQGAAMRPESHHRPGQLGIGDEELREDKHLSEITALIDPCWSSSSMTRWSDTFHASCLPWASVTCGSRPFSGGPSSNDAVTFRN